MKKIAFIFPGQGSQQVGMGASFLADEKSKTFYTIADQQLAYPLSELMLEGPIEELTLTYYAQPALLTTGVMVADYLMQRGVRPEYAAGHSLGEFSALVAAGALKFEDAVKLVHKRGKYMNEAVPAGEGTMAAIMGVSAEVLQALLQEIDGVVEIANLNCANQIVISGEKEAVKAARKLIKERKLGKAIPLPVSGPFHSSLMKPAEQQLVADLNSCEIKALSEIKVIGNVQARVLQTEQDIRQELADQVCSSVQWERSVQVMIDAGVDTFIECGPGTVLSSLVKKINDTVTCFSVQTLAEAEETIQLLQK